MKREDVDLTQTAEEIDLILRAVRQTLRQPLETEFARGNLTGPQRSVMQEVVRADGISLKELSRRVGLAHSTVSGIVDRLETRGMVKRRVDAADRRLTSIVPAAVVKEFLRDRLPQLTLHPLVEALGRATARERGAIVEGLRALRAVVERK